MKRPLLPKKKTSVAITEEADRLWDALAMRMGLSRGGVLETLIREKAETLKVSQIRQSADVQRLKRP